MLSFLADAWAAYSFAATLIGAGGVLALVAAFLLGPYLPAFLRHALFFGGAFVLAGAVYGQVEHARGAAEQAALVHARALAAEEKRREAAERIGAQIAAQATRDLADERAASRRLKETLDAVQHDPDRDSVCLRPADAVRLRSLVRPR